MKSIAQIAAVMAIGAAGFVGCNKNDTPTADTRTPGEQAADAVKKSGDSVGKGVDATTQKSSDVASSMKSGAQDMAAKVNATMAPTGADNLASARKVLDGITSNAFSNNNWNDMAGYLTAADQKRVSGDMKPDLTDLNSKIDKFRDLWKSKYGSAFGSMNADEVYNTQFLSVTGAPGASGDVKASTATVAIPASHDMPALNVPMVAENGKWRVDISDDIDAKTLQDNVNKAVSDLVANSTKWPDDKQEAYRLLTHRILMALTNTKG